MRNVVTPPTICASQPPIRLSVSIFSYRLILYPDPFSNASNE